MSEDKKVDNALSVNINLGKEIDAALGEAIRGLLRRPAEEVGDLLADGIGILADKVRRKRELNARRGIEEVRKKIEASGIEVEDIVAPKEEELHLLLNGLSLSDDEIVRDMWAGLFASALDPKSGTRLERPLIRTLESLSAIDVKVIYFLSFAEKADRNLRGKSRNFSPANIEQITPEEKEKLKSMNNENAALKKAAILEIEGKADEYGLNQLSIRAWSENLLRLGVIEPAPSQYRGLGSLHIKSFDERGLLDAFSQLSQKLNDIQQRAQSDQKALRGLYVSKYSGLELQVQFTGFGRRLAEACGLLD